jgi:hypothetical protein
LITDTMGQLDDGAAIVCFDTLNRSLEGSESKDEGVAAYVRAADAEAGIRRCDLSRSIACTRAGSAINVSITGCSRRQLNRPLLE